ncbi:MAG: pyridoxal phosphate-dependent aminotransferase [candidate division KSB1 bacterium]|nr:pyridoxal phosphate-dependent aminotransferase [candidate division KSB1 bacterium]MDZ7334307.1 pyridoxal phosphate-dependent aminotransferase [candidate division KSB1 bacterium]MDZ7356475.1 pyridoxal phosphate-dependent aminotransferase [candidate division KSB1 bacterium]MDZ7400482.1 pyridoxal phosphate-dependent aminotransferase [candidate division KSB1 bacterium]
MISKYISQAMEQSSWIRRMFEIGKEMKLAYGAENVYDLSLGNPILEPPPEFFRVFQKIANNTSSGRHRYMSNAGFEDVRENVALYLRQKNMLNAEMKHIIMSCGAGGAINVILKTIMDPGDEVIITAPYFSEYIFYIHNQQGKVVIAETDDQFNLDLDEFDRKITPRTKAIIINSPNNPTGKVYDKQTLMGLVMLLKDREKKYQKEIYVISDEPYREIVFDGRKAPSIVPLYDNSFMAYSWSKSLAVPGDRIGYIAVNPAMNDVNKVIDGLIFSTRILGFINAPAVMQLAVGELLHATVKVSYYESKRDYIYQRLTEAGYEIVKPEGTFYMFPKAPGGDDLAFIQRAKERRVLVVPGKGFGREKYFRLSFCMDDRTITRAVDQLVQLVK